MSKLDWPCFPDAAKFFTFSSMNAGTEWFLIVFIVARAVLPVRVWSSSSRTQSVLLFLSVFKLLMESHSIPTTSNYTRGIMSNLPAVVSADSFTRSSRSAKMGACQCLSKKLCLKSLFSHEKQ